jgi:hypothetical protein
VRAQRGCGYGQRRQSCRCRHGEAARGLSAIEMNEVTRCRAQLARWKLELETRPRVSRAGVRGRAKRLGEGARARGRLRASHGTPGRQRPCATGRGDVRATVRPCTDAVATPASQNSARACAPSDAPGGQADRPLFRFEHPVH